MKFGFRKPSIKKSIKARTTGRVKRAVKKAVNPLYGKKGMGIINNPKKALYNKAYNKTTIGINSLFSNSSTTTKQHLNNIYTENYNYVNVSNRDSIYANSTNTYTSEAGKKCIEYEKTLLHRVSNYTNVTCPYCNNKLDTIPERSKMCKYCRNKIHPYNRRH